MHKFLMLLLTISLFFLSSCGDDALEESTTGGSKYKIEITFEGAYKDYFKEVTLLASKANNSGLAPIIGPSGKTIPAEKLNDKNFSFSASNIFTINENTQELKLKVSMSNPSLGDKTPEAIVHIKVYKDGKLISEESGNATSKYEYSSSSTLS